MNTQIISGADVEEALTERFDPIDCLDERSRTRANSTEPPASGRYIEVQGPGRTLLIPLGEDVVRVGRGLAADLRLDENSVSRRHAILAPHAEGVRLLDEHSSNGTFVNGERIQQAELRHQDVIGVGRVQLRYLEV